MNKTNIEWVRNPDGSQGFTLNPVVGCLRGCDYCYARRFAERGLGECGLYEKGHRFQPRFFPERLGQIRRRWKRAGIFICSMGELFGPWVPEEWTAQTIDTARACPWHRFYFLTKYPENLARWNPWPDNAWVGATATDASSALHALGHMENVKAAVRFLSLEPLLGPVDPQRAWPVEWIIVGAQTGPAAVAPQPEWIDTIARFAKRHKIALFEKNNLGLMAPCQEFPGL